MFDDESITGSRNRAPSPNKNLVDAINTDRE